MTPLAQCFNAPKKDSSTSYARGWYVRSQSATIVDGVGMSVAESFFATLVSPLRALQIP
jgi:hypothetical protein